MPTVFAQYFSHYFVNTSEVVGNRRVGQDWQASLFMRNNVSKKLTGIYLRHTSPAP